MIDFDLWPGVTAFTAGRDDVLPFEVTQAHQVHGYGIAKIDRPGITKDELEGIDALITDVPGIALGARSADCIPILLYDPHTKSIAAVHSGWRGTVKRISQKVIFRLQQEYNAQPGDLRALIGPGICRRCFQVGEEIVQYFRDADFPLDSIYSWEGAKREGDASTGHHIDLFEANRILLEEAGILPENICVSGLCTYEDGRFYSARREGAACGRNISVIKLNAE